MRLSTLLVAAGLGLAGLATAAHALTYDSHISRNGDGSAANFLDPDLTTGSSGNDGGLQVRFGSSSGSDENDGGTSPFLDSTDHNFSAPEVGMPFGGMIQGENTNR